MQRIILLLLCYLSCFSAVAQKYDYHWLMGYGAEPDSGFGTTHINFNYDPPTVYFDDTELNFLSCNATFSDSTGELLFYTNGIEIYNSAHEQLFNSQGFNNSPYHDNYQSTGLQLAQGVLALASSTSEDFFFLFHLKLELVTVNQDSLLFFSKGLYFTKIDPAGDNGLGVVVEKGIPIIEDTLTVGGLTATRHANGRDWWLLMPEHNSNRYYRILLNENGVQLIESQTVGTPSYTGLGQACFSPDGNWYVRNNMLGGINGDDYLDIYRFDRCTGLLSDHLRFPYGNGVNAGGGAAISPDSRFLYIGHRNYVYQYDLEAIDIEETKDTVVSWDGFKESGFLVATFFLGQLAPDGKVFFNATGGISYLHVIHNPNGEGSECRFEQRGVDLPTYNAFSLPNFPNYRLGPIDGSPCDTLGINNLPLAAFNYYADSSDYLSINFWDYSYYEPTDWEWTFGDGATGSSQTPVHSYAEPGVYQVCLTASNEYGSDTLCKWLELFTTGVKEILPEEGKLLIYPNPATTELTVRLLDHEAAPEFVYIYDINGRLVLKQIMEQSTLVLDTGNLPNGMYVLSLSLRDGRKITERVVILH